MAHMRAGPRSEDQCRGLGSHAQVHVRLCAEPAVAAGVASASQPARPRSSGAAPFKGTTDLPIAEPGTSPAPLPLPTRLLPEGSRQAARDGDSSLSRPLPLSST